MKKVISLTAFIIVLTLGFLYLNQGLLASDDNDSKKDCSYSCTQKNKEVKAGGEYASYEFTTDKACCDEMKNSMQTGLLTVAGIKEVKFSSACGSSKMTSVTVYYSAGETTEELISGYLKDKNFDCSYHAGCSKDGVKSGESKDGTDCPKVCPEKKKNKESKQL